MCNTTGCSIDGCQNQSLATKKPALCWTHYRRLQKTGSAEAQYINKGKICNVEGCKKEANIKGLCKKHRNIQLKYGDPTAKGRYSSTKGKVCEAPGCQENVRSSGLCTNHYANYIYRKQRYGMDRKAYLNSLIQPKRLVK